jgi:hypothetical protein
MIWRIRSGRWVGPGFTREELVSKKIAMIPNFVEEEVSKDENFSRRKLGR